jgi:hypothetical protein
VPPSPWQRKQKCVWVGPTFKSFGAWAAWATWQPAQASVVAENCPWVQAKAGAANARLTTSATARIKYNFALLIVFTSFPARLYL